MFAGYPLEVLGHGLLDWLETREALMERLGPGPNTAETLDVTRRAVLSYDWWQRTTIVVLRDGRLWTVLRRSLLRGEAVIRAATEADARGTYAKYCGGVY